MSFLQNVTRRFGSKPVCLYLIVFGSESDAYVAYTDSVKPMTYDGFIYNPLPINRSALVLSGGLDKSNMTIQVPKDSRLSDLFRVAPPTQLVQMTIRQGHIGDGEFFVIWTGRIKQGQRRESVTEFSCEPLTTMMRHVGLRRNYQHSCQVVLYGEYCGASKALATRNSNVVSAQGSILTLPDNWNDGDPGKYIGGLVSWSGQYGAELRRILKIDSINSLKIAGLLNGLSNGDVVSLIKGCNHQRNDCSQVHNNINNYRGHWLIPTKNPVNKNPF